MKSIRLTTPAQDKEDNPSVELDPGTLENWLDDLSNQDIIETVKSLDKALSSFNELKLPAAKRHKLLEVYFAALQKLLQGYDEMRLAQLNVSTKQKQKLCNDIVWLYIKLSHGYKIIVKEELQGANNSSKPQYLLLTTFRAIELTVISLLYAYRYGLEMPPLTFLELNQLYAFAEYKNIAYKPVRSAKGYAKTPTICSFYTLALVFTSIDPTQYKSYTLEVLFLALQPFLFNCKFNNSIDPEDDSYIYKIRINEDSQPAVLPIGQPATPNEGSIYLDIGDFISEIDAWLDSNKNSKNTFLIEDELELFPGVLEKLHAIREKSVYSVDEVREEAEEAKSVKLIFGLQALESILITKSIDLDIKLDYKTSEWETVSESPTHLELTCNLCNFDEPLPLGELVSIVDCDEDGQVNSLSKLAYISSLEQLEEGKLLIKLVVIMGVPQASTYIMMNENSTNESGTQHNGIYITNEEESNDQHVLIVNRSHLIQSPELMLKTRSSCLQASVSKTINETPCYAFLKIKILDEQNYGLNGCTITSLAS